MRSARALRLYVVAAATAVLDQATKLAARALLTPGKSVAIIPGFFDLDLVYNRGAAFGILPDWTPLLVILGLCAIYAFFRLGNNAATQSSRLIFALGLLTGGAIGNLIDRFASREQAVTDFISLHITARGRIYSWPNFNVADIGIVTGAALLILNVYAFEKARNVK